MRPPLARKSTQVLRSSDVVAPIRDGIAIVLLNTPDAAAARGGNQVVASDAS